MRLDALIEGLQEMRALTRSGDTLVYVESEIIVNGKALDEVEQIVIDVECLSKVTGGDFIVIKVQ